MESLTREDIEGKYSRMAERGDRGGFDKTNWILGDFSMCDSEAHS